MLYFIQSEINSYNEKTARLRVLTAEAVNAKDGRNLTEIQRILIAGGWTITFD